MDFQARNMFQPSNAELKRLLRLMEPCGGRPVRFHSEEPSLLASLLALTSCVLITCSMFYEKYCWQFNWLCATAAFSFTASFLAMLFGSWKYQNESGQFTEYIYQNWVWNTICSFLCGGSFIDFLVYVYTSLHYTIMNYCFKQTTEIDQWVPYTLSFMHFVVGGILLANRVNNFLKVWNCKRYDLDEQFPS